jgi:hypothetical protein
VACGGKATVDRMRLLCRAHNQYAAERKFGTQFMIDKRRGAQRVAAQKRASAEKTAARAQVDAKGQATAREQAGARAQVSAKAQAAEDANMTAGAPPSPAAAAKSHPDHDVSPWLRALGFNAAEARRAAVACDGLPHDSLEERVRFSLKLLQPPHRRLAASVG